MLVVESQTEPLTLALIFSANCVRRNNIQGNGAGAQAILDGWNRSQIFLNGRAGVWYLGSGSTHIVCVASQLYK